jgi:hypothetical protein
LLTYAQRLTAAPVTVTYNDKGGREKRNSNNNSYLRNQL